MGNARTTTSNRLTAFTLIELLIVMLITSILALGINATYQQAHLVWSRTEQKRSIYQDVRLITETLRNELGSLYLPPPPGGNNTQVTAGSFKPFSLEDDELAFFTLTPGWKSNVTSSRVARVRYAYTKKQEGGESVLQRFEQLYSGQTPIAAEVSDVVAKTLSEFRIEPFSGDTSNSASDSNSVPKALKISLSWPATSESGDFVFETIILIPVQQALGQ